MLEMERIVERAQQGDSEAFGELYKALAPKMKGVCAKTLYGNDEAVDDLVHDAFLLAFLSIGKLKNPKRFAEWMTTITRNVALRFVKSGKRLATTAITKEAEGILQDEYDSEADAAVARRAEGLVELMQRLPEGYRNVVELSVFQGMNHNEIAGLLGIAPHSSSSQLARAKKMLRRLMREYWYVPALLIALLATLRLWMSKPPKAEHKTVVKDEPEKKEQTPDRQLPVEIEMAEPAAKPATITLKTDTVTLKPDTATTQPCLRAEAAAEDTLAVQQSLLVKATEDTVPVQDFVPQKQDVQERITLAVKEKKHRRKWGMMLTGALSPALAQNVYLLVAGDGGIPPIDSEGNVLTRPITTWSEYYDYVLNNCPPSAARDSLLNIAIDNIDQGNEEMRERVKHSKPVTFGLSFQKKVNDRWSIESGVDYTLLRSTFEIGSPRHTISRRQKIHYLGIPLRASYSFAHYKRFSAYAAAGVKLDIPVKASVTKSTLYDYIKFPGDTISTIHTRPQWSVGASVGAQYRITPHIGLYVEPTLNYYIPTGGDTRTIRTDKPLVFSLPLGLRFTW